MGAFAALSESAAKTERPSSISTVTMERMPVFDFISLLLKSPVGLKLERVYRLFSCFGVDVGTGRGDIGGCLTGAVPVCFGRVLGRSRSSPLNSPALFIVLLGSRCSFETPVGATYVLHTFGANTWNAYT